MKIDGVLPEESARKVLENYVACDHSHRWLYKEVLVIKHVPELIHEVERLRAVNDELSAEVSRLSGIARY